LAAIRLDLSNGRVKIRLIGHRAFGYHSPTPSSRSSTSAAAA
jgi:hypothetical protein